MRDICINKATIEGKCFSFKRKTLKITYRQLDSFTSSVSDIESCDCSCSQQSHDLLCPNHLPPGLAAVPSAVQSLSDDLLKYYQLITRAILGDDPHLMKVCSPAPAPPPPSLPVLM